MGVATADRPIAAPNPATPSRTATHDKRITAAIAPYLSCPTGRHLSASLRDGFHARRRRLQSHPAAAARTGGAVADEFDAGGVERGDQLHQRIDIAADDAVA